MDLYLALDAGGTKTDAALADRESVLARVTGCSIKALRLAPPDAAAHLRALLADLEANAGLALRGRVACTCIGISGVSAPGVRDWLRQAFHHEAVGGELLLLGDEVIALDAAFGGGRGVLVIAGTGSNIVGRAATGAMVHTGGWGPALADEGSGHWIGAEALRACFRAIDSGAPSPADAVHPGPARPRVAREHLPALLLRAMDALGLGSLDDVIGTANAPGFGSAALVPTVVDAARGGDVLAGQVLEQAGLELARLVAAAMRKIELLEAPHGRFCPPEVAHVGSVLARIPEVRAAMHGALRGRFPGIVLQEQLTEPLDGALWHARGCR